MQSAQQTSRRLREKCARIESLQPRHLYDVLLIERARFEFPWTPTDFTDCLRRVDRGAIVAETGEGVAGFAVFEQGVAHLRLLNLAVSMAAGRLGIGSQLVANVLARLTPRCHEALCEVRERNLAAQLFLREQGFRAVCVLRNHYQDTDEDAYLMRYERPTEAAKSGNALRRLLAVIRG